MELPGISDAAQELNFTDNSSSELPKPRLRTPDFGAVTGNISRLENEVVMLREQLSKFEIERSEANEQARRCQYDLDNYRKRMERERSDLLHNLLTNVATEMLPVIDNLSRALNLAAALPGEKSIDFQQFIDGIGLVNQQLDEVLVEMGIQPIISLGEAFDPHLHEAVATEQTAAFPPQTVIAELLRGYRLDDKIIRHSLVKVSTSVNSQLAFTKSEAE